MNKYKKALEIACELMAGGCIYGIDVDTLYEKIMEENGIVCSTSYKDFIIKNLDRFSDNDKVRYKAIKRLGWW